MLKQRIILLWILPPFQFWIYNFPFPSTYSYILCFKRNIWIYLRPPPAKNCILYFMRKGIMFNVIIASSMRIWRHRKGTHPRYLFIHVLYLRRYNSNWKHFWHVWTSDILQPANPSIFLSCLLTISIVWISTFIVAHFYTKFRHIYIYIYIYIYIFCGREYWGII